MAFDGCITELFATNISHFGRLGTILPDPTAPSQMLI